MLVAEGQGPRVSAIVSRGWDQDYALVDKKGRPVQSGVKIRGDVIVGGRAPHKPDSTGRVWVLERGRQQQYYPGGYGLTWLPRDKWHRNPLPGGEESYRGGPTSPWSKIHPRLGPTPLAALKMGWIKLDPERVGGGTSETQHVDAQTRAAILAAAAEYEALALEIDRRYEAGAVAGVEDLEQRAYALEEWLEHELTAAQVLEDERLAVSEHKVGLEETLVQFWHDYLTGANDPAGDRFAPYYADPPGTTRERKLADMVRGLRHMIPGHGGMAAGMSFEEVRPLSDEQALAAARDAYDRYVQLRAAYKRPGKKIDMTKLKRKRGRK